MEADYITMDLMLEAMKTLLCNEDNLSRGFALDFNLLCINAKELYLDLDKSIGNLQSRLRGATTCGKFQKLSVP